MINVTKTSLPPIEEYIGHLRGIWDRAWLTNNGVLLQELEAKLKLELDAPFLHFVTNGTLALQIAIKALGVKGEVITTPFSYVATTGSILWEGCKPVFVDIEPRTFCIDPGLIEAAITPKTTAILATHVYGFPCDVERIAAIARKHGLKVIYDGAHAFGVRWKGKSLLSYGDITTLSTHATKLFHTIEGGVIISQDADVARTVGLMRSFGHENDDHYLCGINAKASEFQAAMGLCLLPRISEYIRARREIANSYDGWFGNTGVLRPAVPFDLSYNFAYYPVVLSSMEVMEKVRAALRAIEVIPRRYFYPTLNRLPYLDGGSCPVSEDITSRVLCLPLYPELSLEAARRIASTTVDALKQ